MKKLGILIGLAIGLISLQCTTPVSSGSGEEDQRRDYFEDLEGAWTITYKLGDTVQTHLMVFADGYLSYTAFNLDRKEFYYTHGGPVEVTKDSLIFTREYFSSDSSKVGRVDVIPYTVGPEKKRLALFSRYEKWERLDQGTGGELAGAWLITGRKRDGEMRKREIGERKTMKILSGTRFQWIAYHTGTGKFSGSGGGTYTTKEGKYTENIEFFSRDSSRVGASLEFNYELIGGEWHHSGLSSKGKPIYEVWTLRSVLGK
ncbi:MAG: membrane or secreted protein [Bacteroidota bacterium]